MRSLYLFFFFLLALPIGMQAQNSDDMYFDFSKKKSSTSRNTVSNTSDRKRAATTQYADPWSEESSQWETDYNAGSTRDVDEYNRRGSQSNVVTRLVNDTLYVTTVDSVTREPKVTKYRLDDENVTGQTAPEYDNERRGNYSENYYDDDYYYTTRLYRYRGVRFYDPFVWDICFGWYDPWYDPWYGLYAPYYRFGFYSWYDWGWGWNRYPGWDLCWGHHGYYRDRLHPGTYMPSVNRGQRAAGMGNYSGRAVSSRGSRTGTGRLSGESLTSRGVRDNAYAGTRGTRVGSSNLPTRGTRVGTSTNSVTRGSSRTTTVPRTTTQSTTRGTRSVISTPRSSSGSSMPSTRGGSFSGGSRGGSFGGGGFGGGGGSRGGGSGRGGR